MNKWIIAGAAIGGVGLIYLATRKASTATVVHGGGGVSPQELLGLAQQAQAPAIKAVEKIGAQSAQLQSEIIEIARGYQEQSVASQAMMLKTQEQTAKLISAQSATFEKAIASMQSMMLSSSQTLTNIMKESIARQQSAFDKTVNVINQQSSATKNLFASVIDSFTKITQTALANRNIVGGTAQSGASGGTTQAGGGTTQGSGGTTQVSGTTLTGGSAVKPSVGTTGKASTSAPLTPIAPAAVAGPSTRLSAPASEVYQIKVGDKTFQVSRSSYMGAWQVRDAAGNPIPNLKVSVSGVVSNAKTGEVYGTLGSYDKNVYYYHTPTSSKPISPIGQYHGGYYYQVGGQTYNYNATTGTVTSGGQVVGRVDPVSSQLIDASGKPLGIVDRSSGTYYPF